MLPSFLKRPQSASKLCRERDAVGYDEVGSGSGSSSGGDDEEQNEVAPSGAFPSTVDDLVPQLQTANAPNLVPDPWSLHQEENVGDNFIAKPDENIPTQQEAELLEAWMTKRKAIRIEQEKQKFQSMMDPRTGGFQQPGSSPQRNNVQRPPQETSDELQPPWFMQHPVDVDSGLEIKPEPDDDKKETTHYHIPTAMATVVPEDSHSVTSKPGSIASFLSNSTSDMTPVVSNKTFKPPHRPSESASISHSLPTAIESPTSGEGEDSQESSSGNKGCSGQCAAFLDVRTYHGKLALLLLTILVLAVTTMVVSALLARQSRDIINNNNSAGGPPPFLTRAPTTPVASAAPSFGPTVAPTPPETGDNTPTAAPSSPPPTGIDDTASPSTNVPTQEPTLIATTAQPFTAIPTQSPTTSTPTSAPTDSPSTSAPTIQALEDLVLVRGDVVEGPSEDAAFGSSLALSGDGRVMVVGSPGFDRNSGRVDIFELVDFPGDPVPQQWVERFVIEGTAGQGTLGKSVGVSSDGTIVAVSEPNVERRSGRVTVYAYIPASGDYAPLGNPIVGSNAGSYSGESIAISANGLRVAVGAPYYGGDGLQLQGQVVIYELLGSEWTQMGSPISGTGTLDWLGSAVALSDDGLRVVASAPRNSDLGGYVGTWEWNYALRDWERWGGGDIFNESEPSRSSDRFGHSVALSTTSGGVSRLAVGVPWKSVGREGNAGMVVVYELDPAGNRWIRLGDSIVEDTPTSGNELGSAVDFVDGRFLLVGIPGAADSTGHVRLYRFDEEAKEWELHPVPLTGSSEGDDFGVSLAARREVEIDRQGFSLVVGAISDNRGGIGYVQSFLEE